MNLLSCVQSARQDHCNSRCNCFCLIFPSEPRGPLFISTAYHVRESSLTHTYVPRAGEITRRRELDGIIEEWGTCGLQSRESEKAYNNSRSRGCYTQKCAYNRILSTTSKIERHGLLINAIVSACPNQPVLVSLWKPRALYFQYILLMSLITKMSITAMYTICSRI